MVTSAFDLDRYWTAEDLLELPDDGNRYEIVDGKLRVSPGPAWRHNTAASRLARQLEPALPDSLVVLTPGGSISVPRGYVIPDLAVVDAVLADSDSHIGDAHHVQLVVEAASPSSAIDDVVEKAAIYAQAGVPSYWRVEFEPELRIVVQELRGGAYVEVAAGRTVTVEQPFPVTVGL